MYKWLLSLSIVQKLLESIINQGFSVLLLIAAVSWFGYENHHLRIDMNDKVDALDEKVESCNNNLLQYYKEDRLRNEAVIERATNVIERIESRLE